MRSHIETKLNQTKDTVRLSAPLAQQGRAVSPTASQRLAE
jgi:hypothetical protein